VKFFSRHVDIVLAASALALAVAGALVGCRAAHLGPDTGQSYRAAIAAQRAADSPEGGPALSATDAKQVLQVHRTGEAKAGGNGTTTGGATMAPPVLGAPAGAGGAGWPGATGGITLEAK
jgi:hypothetical protein